MIPRECKRLAEVDFPIAEVSRWALQDKRVRSGYPASIHIWWARRPLASSRAVLLALLWPDPCDPLCPAEFKVLAAGLLRQVPGCNPGSSDETLREALLKFIAAFANWNLISNRTYLDVARKLVVAAYDGEPPLVADPFAGSGAIPLEALRLGCDANASDLNPVAFMILQTVLGDDADNLAEKLEAAAAEINSRVRADLAKYYPSNPERESVGYFWARTVHCEAPACGVEFPLLKSFWLSNTRGNKSALRYKTIQTKTGTRLEFEVFEPRAGDKVPEPTVSRAKARCPSCEAVLAPDRVRAQLRAHRGGTRTEFDEAGKRIGGALLMAVAEQREGSARRVFRIPNDADHKAVYEVTARLQELSSTTTEGRPSLVPDEPLTRVPVAFGVINVWVYGMETWGDLFNARQALALSTIARMISEGRFASDAPKVRTLLAFALSIFARSCNGNARLRPDGSAAPAFGMQALPFTWAFPESVPWGSRSETFGGAVDTVLGVLRGPALRVPSRAQVQCRDARDSALPDESVAVWFTDPPYYDAIPYSYLSDFFYVWMKRSLGTQFPDVFASRLTPKDNEIVSYRIPDSNETPTRRFERMMCEAFGEGRRVLKEGGIGSIVFAHKTTEGWEALLSGIISSGWTITASWPIATEAANRLRARNAAALATSVHLICRPRPDDAGIGDWGDVLRRLPAKVGEQMEHLQREGVRGADLVFACIGPALEIYSQYTRVETADGREVPLAEYLEKVWEVVGRAALEHILGTAEARARNGATGALEEDARLTALFLWTLQSTASDDEQSSPDTDAYDEDEDEEESASGKAKGFTLIFDVARRFAQPLGIDLPKWENRIIDTDKGVVRLLPVRERATQLFGSDGASVVASHLETGTSLGSNPLQGLLFPELDTSPRVRSRTVRTAASAGELVSDGAISASLEATTLDRVHAAMLLQAAGRTNALRTLVVAEQERGPDFLRLANALSALYPAGSDEKRLLDAMLLAAPR